MNRVSMHLTPKGPVTSFRLVTGRQFSKQNLMNAFLKNPSSPQRVAAPVYRPWSCTINRPRAGQAGAVGTEGEDGMRGKGVEP
jgi:hypothetical protein